MSSSLYSATNGQDYTGRLANTLFSRANGPTWLRLLLARFRPQKRPLPYLSHQSGNPASAVAPANVQWVPLEQVRSSVGQARSRRSNAASWRVKSHLYDQGWS
jgi:hypothetical protein